MLTAFKQYLLTLKLRPVSRKLYLLDVSRFLTWLGHEPTLNQLFSPESYASYLGSLTTQAIAPSMHKRTVASLKQFGTFLSLTYSIPNPLNQLSLTSKLPVNNYIKYFTNYLILQQLSNLTIRSYKSDVVRFLDWATANIASNELSEVLTTKNIEKYLKYLSESGSNLSSTIERKSKSIARFADWYTESYPQPVMTDNTRITSHTDETTSLTPMSKTSSTEQMIKTFAPNEDFSDLNASSDLSSNFVKKDYSRKSKFSLVPYLASASIRNFVTLLILLIFTSALTIFGYRQFSSDVYLTAAYPSTPVTPNRQLSFQGRLENAAGTPITTATDLTFKLYNALTGPTELYSTGTCSITPDADGVFSTQIGGTCGAAITSSIFTENASIWLEVIVVSDILTPRQPIASIAYALNSETIQGIPLSATMSAIRNTIIPMNEYGEIIVGEQSPRLAGVSGTFQISAPALSFITTAGTNGNISLAPDGTGQINLTGNTTSTNFFNVSNAQLTTGSLITGTAANANAGFKLIDLLSGSSPTSKFSVNNAGNTTMAGDLTITGDDLFMNTNTTGMLLVADGTNFNPTAVTGDISINGSGATAIGADKITESMLKAVDAAVDEECLSYETTTGDFEWQTCGTGGGSSAFNDLTSGTNTTASMIVGTGASLSYTGSGIIDASKLLGGTWAIPGTIGSSTPNTAAFTTLTSSGNSTIGTGASSINTIGSVTTPGTLTLHGATTLDNTFTISGSNLTSLGGDLTVTGTAWTATPTISGLITATSGITSNGTVILGDNGDTVYINSNDWDISTTGDMSNIGSITADGTIAFTGTTIGLGTSNSITTVNIGTGTAGNIFNIGTDNTAKDTLNIGSALDDIIINGAGTGSLINFTNFDVATTGNITVAAGVGLDTNAAGILALGDTAATTINIGASGSLTRSINIGTGTGADTINIGTGNTTADAINLGGLSTSQTNITGITNFAGGTTYYVDASGNAKFLDLQIADTGNPGITVGNSATGFIKIGSATIGDNNATYLSLDTNSDTVSNLNINDDGSITFQNNLSSQPATVTEGSVYYNNANNHLFVSDGATYHRLATDMTTYTTTNASVTNQNYIEIAHGQGTNDLSLTGWFYDTISSLWKKISDWNTTTTANLDNQFNPLYTQKSKVSTIALNSTYVYGTGADGSISVTADKNINTDTLISGRSCADGGDAVNYSVTTLTSTSAILSSTPSTGCLAVGDEVLLINLQGTSTKYSNVGNYETLRISSISTSTITFTTTKNKYYGDDSGTDTNIGTATTNQRVMLQRVPNYTNVTLSNAGTDFTPSAWAAPKGGVMFFRATGTVTIPTGTTINANALGYNNGTAGASTVAATGGESFCAAAGTAGGSGGDSDNNPADAAGVCGGGGGGGANSANGGNAGSAGALGGAGGGGGNSGSTAAGNGYGAGGAGGGYGTGGTGGAAGGGTATAGGNGGTGTSGTGGTGVFTTPTAWAGGGGGGGTYGDTYLNQIFMGAGGAGGGRGDSNATTTDTPVSGGAGGKGGGILMISADTISVTSTGVIQSNGGAGGDAANTTYAGGGGGGAGGSIHIVADTVTASTTDLITASSGAGSTTGTGADGGNGGVGRIVVSYKNTLTANASEPDYPTAPYLHKSGYYGTFVSKEINTPGATALTTLSWTPSTGADASISAQTRTGSSPDSTDGSWEDWKPSTATTNIKVLNNMGTTGNWTGTGITVADGLLARNVDYYEQEDITNAAGESIQLSSVGSVDGYAETSTITSPDLSNFSYLSAWVYATASGQIKLAVGESAATEQEETIQIDTASTWQKVYWDISDIPNSAKDAVGKLRITVLSPNQTVYIDNIQAEQHKATQSDNSLTLSTGSTPNTYFQYRFIITSKNSQTSPSLSNVTLTYNDGAAKTIDASSIRSSSSPQYYSSSHITTTESSLDSIKSTNIDKTLTGISQTGDYDPGTGTDGDITVNSDTSINTTSLISGRSCADGGDAVNYSVTALSSTTATIESAPSAGCLNVGDEILLINLRGTTTQYANVGNYETLRISQISNNVITFASGKTMLYGDDGGDTNIGLSTSNQVVMLQRIPNYSTVTISGSGTDFYPDNWVQPTDSSNNGAGEGGVMFFRATGAVSIGTGATINATGKGYLGGAGDNANGAKGGEAFCGGNTVAGATGGYYSGSVWVAATTPSCGGGGGAAGSTTNNTNGTASLGGGGGGGGGYKGTNASYSYGSGGGGGGFGSYGTYGTGVVSSGTSGGTSSSGNGGAGGATGPYTGGGGGGGTYGDANLAQIFFGAGGAGGGGHYTNVAGGNGGNGGGIVYIAANSVSVSGNLQSNGNVGGSGTTFGGDAGGGAGGSVKIMGDSLSLGTTLTTASGGTGGSTSAYPGGSGGTGRIATYYATSITGTPTGAATAQVPSYNYSMFISDEVPTPNATSYNKIKWLADLDSYGMIQLQTRSGKSNNSTDDTWEAWKPVIADTNVKSLQSMNTHGDWTGTNVTVADGDVTRNIDYFEDEDESSAGNTTKLTATAASGYAEANLTADLSSYDYITAWIYSSALGNQVTLGFGETAATDHEKTFYIQNVNTWQKIYWDITDIPTTQRDGLSSDKLRITLPTNGTILRIDNITADRYLADSAGSNISSTPNEYIQYRAILTTTNSAYHPKLHNVQIDWTNGFKVVQTDADTVRLYNYTGISQQLRLDAIVFGADLAEWYTVDDPSINDGDLVALSGKIDEFGVPILRKTNSGNDRQIIGAISTKAGQTLGIEADNRRLLALAGRIPIRMDLASPSIEAGDYLTSSDQPGFARKARPGEMTIGRSFETWHHDAPTATILAIIQQPIETPEVNLSDKLLTILKDTWEVWDQSANVQIARLAAYSEVVTGRLTVGLTTTDTLQVATISPIATGSAITISAPVIIQKQDSIPSEPLLMVEGAVDATTISARTAKLQNIEAQTITANNIVADTISANHIEGLDAKIASMSGNLSDSDVETITDRIKARLTLLTDPIPTAADIPVSPPSINSLESDQLVTTPISLSSSDIDFITINNYLAVIGSATITSLDVTANMYTNSIQSKNNLLTLQPTGIINMGYNTLIVDSSGQVVLNGDLSVSGKITASELNLERLNIYNEDGIAVASIDASGSANLAELTTNMITIASSSEASNSATPSGLLTSLISSNASAGESVLVSPDTELTINNSHITPNSLIYLTPTTNTDNKVLFVKAKDEDSFTVGIDTPSSADISFNWWIIQLK